VLANAMHEVLQRIDNASNDAMRPPVRLLAVSKTRSSDEVAALAAAWSRTRGAGIPAFGENYVQEAAGKIADLKDSPFEWHFIGHLQSNKAADAARLFDWSQTIDRPKLFPLLARHRPDDHQRWNVLVQVNIDDEASKHGCVPAAVPGLAARIAEHPRLQLRGLMAIPAPHGDPDRRRAAFSAMRDLFDALAAKHEGIDTLSMGMSEDLEFAIAEGATMVRVGTALFGPRD
jgi:pyridoxal phosphate enzyme (YggS family)